MDFKQMVGEQIRKIRKLRGMTQERLAEQSGLSFSYISDVERGTRNISLESLGKIINALGVRPAQLFEDIDEITENSGNDEIRNKIEDLITLLSERQIEEVDFVLTLAREFLNTIDRKNR
ncbi:MAG: helix-turn-helix transcriptional regulator [Paenibacillus macerans]|uniref:helix-turn-helix domain-containing protein n=1 Tax=Paenibacillus TaxID=44249 RepID=UPI000ED526D1|nr:helix-turn-helix transcriptional regulator [Paenibacillus macerans]MDU7472655.1 helix-turn-helix transcriptional regulator [Paenibacillus macerans]GBK62131.1 XRE family transcriptional regulator [Paenibacillus macerans]GBK68440.1 XRE family transcriptional regulator [Paenibacillus macerans]